MRREFVAVASTVLLLCATLAAGPAMAQEKLYRWVDAEGQVHYSDALPPEAVNQARRELSKDSGLTTAAVERALTEQERAQAQAEAEAAAALEREREEQRQRDRVLLTSYPSEADLQRAFDERLRLLEESIRAAQVGIDAQRASLATLLSAAAEQEFRGDRVAPKVLESAREAQRQETDLHSLLTRREAEREATMQERDRTLARYRELRDEASRSGG